MKTDTQGRFWLLQSHDTQVSPSTKWAFLAADVWSSDVDTQSSDVLDILEAQIKSSNQSDKMWIKEHVDGAGGWRGSLG